MLHTNPNTGRKLEKNEFQWVMCKPHFLALSWHDTKIVNYLTNYHSPSELQIQLKRDTGKTRKTPRIIPGNCSIQLIMVAVASDYLRAYHAVDTFDQNS